MILVVDAMGSALEASSPPETSPLSEVRKDPGPRRHVGLADLPGLLGRAGPVHRKGTEEQRHEERRGEGCESGL